jgi:hypothetical protein
VTCRLASLLRGGSRVVVAVPSQLNAYIRSSINGLLSERDERTKSAGTSSHFHSWWWPLAMTTYARVKGE